MAPLWLLIVIVIAALGSGLMAGIFYAFSFGVMQALRRLPPADGMAAMRAMNTTILNPMFFIVFFATPAASIVLVIYCMFEWDEPNTPWMLAGSAVYLVGAFLVTVIFNVPMNNALMVADAESDAGRGLWARYLSRWTGWNHVRAIASAAAMVCFVLALS